MDTIRTIAEMRDWSLAHRREGKRIAFVPTMGALHEGHLSLIREGLNKADLLVVSIYVNPTQFGPEEDFAEYPRDLDGDLRKCANTGAHAVFLPTDDWMYPRGYETYITVEELTKNLCGLSRPKHFRGVATIVAKLFNIVIPDVAVFGEKDFQQLVVIKKMVRDLNIPVEIVGHPIVREADGLAMSSRNAYLSPAERKDALSIVRALEVASGLVKTGERDIGAILTRVRAQIGEAKDVRIDYAKIVDPATLADMVNFKPPALLAIAAFVGKTRLIDNRLL